MSAGFFITGTDTHIGKTWATVALLLRLRRLGKTVIGMKPVASGCITQAGRLVNEDALLLQAHASIAADYRLVNPYAYGEAVSPHLAGRDNPLDMPKVSACFKQLQDMAELVLVEGAGGWLSPVNADQDNSDLAKALVLPVILVVAMRLGCINHARLSYQAIAAKGLPCAGWIANCLDPDMAYLKENINTLQAALPVPLLGVLPYQKLADFEALATGFSERELARLVAG